MSTLTFYALSDHAPEIIPASHTREWMDKIPDSFAYRCLPLNIANAFGWDVLCPHPFSATWNDTTGLDAITITHQHEDPRQQTKVVSHFGNGVLTFHIDYIVRTAEGWDTLVTGSANNPKHGIIPLSGIVETDWLPFTFTMNWRMTRAGTVHFEAGEPICTLIPVPHHLLDGITPEILPISANPELEADYRKWAASRSDFIKKLSAGDANTVEQAWQKHYFRGHTPWDAAAQHDAHKSKLRLAAPVDKRPKK